MKFETLLPSDERFKHYLNGSLNSGSKVVAVHSLNHGYPKTRVTFEVLRVGLNHHTPIGFAKAFLESLRARYWIFVLLPLLSYLSFCQVDGVVWRPDVALLVTLGIIFGFSSLAQLSDILDYQKGWDYSKPQDYTVLTKGWLTVAELKKSVIFGLSVSFLVLLFFIISLPINFLLLSAGALVVILFWLKSPFSLKYKVGGEIVVYLLLGPILMAGYALAIVGQVFPEDILLGSLFGLSSMFVYQLKRFFYLMPESRSKLCTTFVYLGFDKSKLYLLSLYSTLVLLTSSYQIFYHGWEWGALHALTGAAGIFLFNKRLGKTVSPLGQNICQLQAVGRGLIFISYSLWILQSTWYFVISGLFYAN